MRYNSLGTTGMFVSEICLGTMTFGGRGLYEAIGKVDQATANQLVRRSLDSGINFIDTADSYSEGEAERMLGESLKILGISRKDVVLSTKGCSPMGTGPNDRGASRGHLTDAVEASLKRLQTDYIDLYHIHAFDPVTPIEQSLRALDDLVRRGLIRYVACSNWSAWHIMKSLGLSDRYGWTRLQAVQAYYTIATRDVEREIVPLLKDQSLGLLVWSPLAGGLLAAKQGAELEGARRTAFDFPPIDRGRAAACIDVMRPIAKSHQCSVAQVALAWLLSRPATTSVIIGAKRLDQLQDNLKSTSVPLSPADIKVLDEVAQLTIEYPAWQQVRQATGRTPPPFSIASN